MNSDQVCNLIELAFDGVERPKDITLHVAAAHDNYDYDRNSYYRKSDHNGRWQDVPDSHLLDCHYGLAHLDKYGIQYYLPAYMIWYIKNYESDDMPSDNTLYTLDHHPKNEKLAKYHKERFSPFDKNQLNACAKFIKFCAHANDDFTDIDFALKKYEQYWKQYEEI